MFSTFTVTTACHRRLARRRCFEQAIRLTAEMVADPRLTDYQCADQTATDLTMGLLGQTGGTTDRAWVRSL